MLRPTLPLVVIAVLLLVGCGQRISVDVADAPSDPAAVTAQCDLVLQRVVDEAGRVDFLHLIEDESELDRAVAGIAQAPLPEAPADRLAYLINAYHLLAMKAVLVQGLPRDLSAWVDRLALYGRTTFTVAGEWRTLQELVDEAIVPTAEPRVYAVLNGMVAGCPRLEARAFTGSDLEQRLEAAMRAFVSDPRQVRYDPTEGILVLSPVMRRYREALGAGDNAAPLALLRRYGIEAPSDVAVRYAPWDWRVIYQAEIGE